MYRMLVLGGFEGHFRACQHPHFRKLYSGHLVLRNNFSRLVNSLDSIVNTIVHLPFFDEFAQNQARCQQTIT